jgi:TonB family protein
MLKPDSTRSSSAFQTRISGPEWIEPDSAEAVSESRLGAFRGREDLPSDLALDLRLREILQQARLTTAANGAVIALALGERMVCRATLGDKSPSVGVSMNTRSGLAGACVQSREMQLCDDSLADPRVNAMACRDLDIRSIVVLPVLGGGELWGILEVFSSAPRAFSDSDLQSLQSLSRKISRTVQEAIQSGSRAVASGAFTRPNPESTVSETLPYPNPAERYSQDAVPRDYRTGVLTVAVLALAVFLGWMVGRVGWSMAVNRAPIQLPLTSDALPPVPVTADAQQGPPKQVEVLDPQPAVSGPEPPISARPTAKTNPEIGKPAGPQGGLVVYEHGKVVFRMPPDKGDAPVKDPADVVEPEAIQKAATREEDGTISPAPVTPPARNNYLLERVEPQYPEAAKQQHIQGPVVLDVLVGIDGSVKDLSVISGDALLAGAATDAVRQWRFKPHQLKGRAVEFETRITVNFALPQ